MSKKNKQKIIKKATEGLLEMFRSGEMSKAVAFNIIRRRDGDDQPSFHWSISNQLIMMLSGTTDARGYRQWQKVGRYVKKEASAIYILGPMTRKVSKENLDTGKKEEKIIITGFKFIPVFKYEDTGGEPLKKPDYTPNEMPPFWNVAKFLGIKVKYCPGNGYSYGAYSPSKQQITLCSQDGFVYFHELAHAVHNTIKELKNGNDPEQEIIAETSAAILCQLQQITGYESQAYNYIKTYTEKMKEQDTLKVITRLLSDVEAIVLKIISVAEELDEEVLLA